MLNVYTLPDSLEITQGLLLTLETSVFLFCLVFFWTLWPAHPSHSPVSVPTPVLHSVRITGTFVHLAFYWVLEMEVLTLCACSYPLSRLFRPVSLETSHLLGRQWSNSCCLCFVIEEDGTQYDQYLFSLDTLSNFSASRIC